MTVQGQSALTYAWDDADRLSTITQGARSIALAYDQADRRSKITFPGNLEQRMTYGLALNRPSAISYFSGTTPVQLDVLTDTTFDGDSRPIKRTATAAVNGIPNAVNTLPTAFTASYTNNRLTTFNGAAWTYDGQGNLTSDGTNTYVWDIRNRLIQIKQGATVTASFEYDALNRRTKKIIGANSTEYLHDGYTPVQEKRAGDITQLITGPGIDDYLSRITTTVGATPTTTTRNYLTDFLGSTTALADDTGVIKTTYGYEPYGESAVSGEATSNPFQYTGRENDGTGLYYYRARYYHPKAKRFISEDPVGQGGGINPNAYVDGSPMTDTDPTGEIIPILIGVGRAYGQCVLQCSIRSTIESQILDDCPADIGDNVKECLKECLNPFNWGGKGLLKRQAQNNKTKRKKVDSLRDRIKEHQDKIKKEPDSDAVNHWSKEIRDFQDQIDRIARKLPGGNK
jgi:RHS repeat-associated protein